MKDQNDFIKSLFVHADTALLLGQRLGELCGHGPVIEQDIAMTNIALDYVGRSRLFFNLISQIENNQKTEDDYAFLRTENEYHNLLIVEYPNTDFAYTVAKQFFIDTFYYLYLDACLTSVNQEIRAIAEKSIKETAYHKKWSSEWVIRLGDGTELSHQKINAAIQELWMYTGEFFVSTDFEMKISLENILPNCSTLKDKWTNEVQAVFQQANLIMPSNAWAQLGGKTGNHTEYMGYILSEMQYMQRTFPEMQW